MRPRRGAARRGALARANAFLPTPNRRPRPCSAPARAVRGARGGRAAAAAATTAAAARRPASNRFPPPRALPPRGSGLDNAGKTTIIKKFQGEAIDTISPTLGFNIVSFDFLSFSLNVWDVGGQKTIRSYWRNYFEQTDGLIWVVDSADRRRLRDCREELAALLSQEKLAGASVLILANKQDMAGALGGDEIADALGLHGEIFKRRHWRVLPCSAFTGDGLVEGMTWLVSDVSSRIFVGE